MSLISQHDLTTLSQTSGGPCVSIFMPTVRAGETLQNPIRFKNLLRDPRCVLHSAITSPDPNGNLASLTFTLNYKPFPNVKIQPEVRYDHTSYAGGFDGKENRVIVGAAYWFPHQGSVSSALLVDYDGQHFDNITTAPVRSVAVHALVSF